MQEYASLLWIVAIALVFWLLIIRPNSKRQKAVQELQAGLEVGDDVMLTAGVFGTIVEITDDHIGVEVAPGVSIRVVRGAIGSKIDRDLDPDDAHLHEPDAERGDDASDRSQGEN